MSTAPSSRKRKAEPEAPSGIFYQIPELIWEAVAGFASPPDVYNLALASKRFHERELEKRKVALATKLLRSSLLSSLGRVLRQNKAGITLDAALALSNLPKGSVVIAGSTMVQACVGKVWGSSDVDVFVTASGAPAVRSWLVDRADFMLGGFDDYNLGLEDIRLTYSVDTHIHHVEAYGKRPESPKAKPWDFSPVEDVEEWYKTRCVYGRDAQRSYADRKWQNFLRPLGIHDIGEDYHIKPLEGHDLPFDFDLMGLTVDFIVAKTECADAYELLQDFDLNICKASFDGKTFRIPDPHLTFNRKSVMEPQRKSLVESYVRRFDGPSWVSTNGTIQRVRNECPRLPFYRNLDRAADALVPPSAMVHSFEIQLPMQFHNFVVKLIRRLRKYRARGIEIIDGPVVENERDFMEMTMFGF